MHNCSKDHENHLCQIIIHKDLEKIMKLVKDAQFFCKNCGRAAHESESLCSPSKIR